MFIVLQFGQTEEESKPAKKGGVPKALQLKKKKDQP